MSAPNKARTIILTCSVAAVTATGAWYGADLKTKQNIRKTAQRIQEATPAERMVQLQETRNGLRAKQIELEKKIAELQAKQAEEKKAKTKTKTKSAAAVGTQ